MEKKAVPQLGLHSGDGARKTVHSAVGTLLMDEVSGQSSCEHWFPNGMGNRQMCCLLLILNAVCRFFYFMMFHDRDRRRQNLLVRVKRTVMPVLEVREDNG